MTWLFSGDINKMDIAVDFFFYLSLMWQEVGEVLHMNVAGVIMLLCEC